MTFVDVIIAAALALGWLFYIGGALMNAQVLWLSLRAKEGERVPSGVFIVFGLWGAFLAYHSVYTVAPHYKFVVPWPVFWVLLPLFLDVYCVGFLILLFLDFVRRTTSRDDDGKG